MIGCRGRQAGGSVCLQGAPCASSGGQGGWVGGGLARHWACGFWKGGGGACEHSWHDRLEGA